MKIEFKIDQNIYYLHIVPVGLFKRHYLLSNVGDAKPVQLDEESFVIWGTRIPIKVEKGNFLRDYFRNTWLRLKLLKYKVRKYVKKLSQRNTSGR